MFNLLGSLSNPLGKASNPFCRKAKGDVPRFHNSMHQEYLHGAIMMHHRYIFLPWENEGVVFLLRIDVVHGVSAVGSCREYTQRS
jgi:hypothetical protein